MNRFLLYLVLTVVCASGYAENYFKAGTVWEYEVFDNGRYSPATSELVYAVDSDGVPCYQEVRKTEKTDSDGNPIADEVETHFGWFVKVDGEKVFVCNPRESEAKWQLVYDFSLKPGEGCLIKETVLTVGNIAKTLYFKYMGMTNITHYDVEAMELKVFWSEEESVDDSKAIGTEYWIPGVGCPDGFDGSYHFFTPEELEMVFAIPKQTLMKVTDSEGNVIVEFRDGSGIAAVDAEDADGPAAYYNLQGVRVENPSGGVFIRAEGGKTSKVLLK